MNIAVFASGNGSNFAALQKAIVEKRLNATICCLICDRRDAFVLKRACQLNIPAFYCNRSSFPTKQCYEQEIMTLLKPFAIELIVLAGYMNIIGPTLLTAFPARIVNIHPSLLPQFPGKNGISDAYYARVPYTGVTVHIVDEGIDTGPILQQKQIAITSEDTLESLTTKIHNIEHALYPEAIQNYIHYLQSNNPSS